MRQIIAEYKQGESIHGLMRKYHMGRDRLVRIIGRKNLRSQKQSAGRKPTITAEQRKQVVELYRHGMSLRDVELKTGINECSIHQIVKAAGINRSMSEAAGLVWSRRPAQQKVTKLVELLLDECA